MLKKFSSTTQWFCAIWTQKILILWLLLPFPLTIKAKERKQLFDRGWQFYLGKAYSAETPGYNDLKWRTVHLPHDWSIEPIKEQIKGKTIGPFSRESVGSAATGQTVGGEGWYRKTFIISAQDASKRLELYFEGIYNQSEIWINGRKAYENKFGYSTFRFDITPFCNSAGKKNIIAVRVVNNGKNSRWYTGSGIYRHVWLISTGKVFINDWGTSINTSSITNSQAKLSISSQVEGITNSNQVYQLKTQIISPSGKITNSAETKINNQHDGTALKSFQFSVPNPQLWNVDTPNRYLLKLILLKKGKVEDELKISFGIRTVSYSPKKGFQINGKALKLKGACVHHDNGLLGAAAFDRAEERKIELLKKNGFNAVRGSHNPMSEGFMNACDSLGMLVIDEAFDQWELGKNPDDYHLYFKDWSAKDIRSLVLRDRNRPSVIMWSIGNEIRERISEKGKQIAGYLKREIQKYDTTRAVTAGVNKYWDKDRKNMLPLDNAFYYLDVAGYNYMWRFYEQEHEKFPNRIMFGSESVANEIADNWRKVEQLPYVIGDFVWTGMDYLGESGIGNSSVVDPKENVHQFMDWPWYNGWCGDLDLLGFKKPQSYYRDVIWLQRPISMAIELPVPQGRIQKVSFWGWPEEVIAWNFPEHIGEELKVNVYSKAPLVKLYLNGKIIAEEKTSESYKASFKVPYQAGELRAVEYFDGMPGASTVLCSPGKQRMLRLSPDRKILKADGQSLCYVSIELIDEKGQVIIETGRKLSISAVGKGARIIASGNGAPNDMDSFNSLTPKLFNGRAMVILRSGYSKGRINLRVKAEGLRPQKISVNCNQISYSK